MKVFTELQITLDELQALRRKHYGMEDSLEPIDNIAPIQFTQEYLDEENLSSPEQDIVKPTEENEYP